MMIYGWLRIRGQKRRCFCQGILWANTREVTQLKNQISRNSNQVFFRALNSKCSRLVAMSGCLRLLDLIHQKIFKASFKSMVTVKKILKKNRLTRVEASASLLQ